MLYNSTARMSRPPPGSRTSSRTTSVRSSSRTPAPSSASSSGRNHETANTTMQRVNEALGTLAKASKDKSVDLKSLGKIISRASQDVESLRHTFAALPRDQAHSKVLTIAKASSSLCGLLVDLKAFSYAQTELQRLSYSLRAWLQVDGPAEEDALVSHMIIPLPQDTSSLTSEIVTLVISTQFQIFATLLRPADTKTDWRDLAGSLVKQTTLQGHLLHWRTFLIDQDTLTSTDTKLQRIDQYLNNLFTLVLKAATGIDSSSSSALYDPDTLLQLRLYAVHCALATPNLSAPAQQQVVHARREAFWDQLRRAVGLYQRSVSSLKFPTAISSLAETIQPILDLAARQHPDLCQGDMYNALQSQLRPKDQLTDEIAKLTVEDSNVKQEDVEKTMKEAIAALDKWRRTKITDPGALPSLQGLMDALSKTKNTDFLDALRTCLSKAFTASIDRKDSAATSALHNSMQAWVSTGKRISDKTSADIQQGAVDLLIQMARYDIESSPTRADNLIEEAKGFIYDEDGIKDFFTARVLSSASYNLGGITQRSCGRPDGLAVRFFKRACTLGRDALQRFPNDEAAKELQAQMANRWGVLANALLHIGDRKASLEASRAALLAGAHKIATVQTIATFDELKSVDSSVISLINAYTRLAALDLLHDPAEVSLRHLYSSQSANKRVTGLILEQQIQALDRSHHKPESKAAIDHLTAELLELYDAKADPIPRARVLLKHLQRLEDPLSLDQLANEFNPVMNLLSSKCDDNDVKLMADRDSMLMNTHFLFAINAYRAPGTSAETTTRDCIAQQITKGLSCLRRITASMRPHPPVQSTALKSIPSNSDVITPARKRTTAASGRKTKSSAALQTPKRTTLPKTFDPPFARNDSFIDSLQLGLQKQIVYLLGLQGMTLLQLQLLQQIHSLCQGSESLLPTRLWAASELSSIMGKTLQSYQAPQLAEEALKEAGHYGCDAQSRASLMLNQLQGFKYGADSYQFQCQYEEVIAVGNETLPARGDPIDRHVRAAILNSQAASTLSHFQSITSSTNDAIASLRHAVHVLNRATSILHRSATHNVVQPQQDGDVFSRGTRGQSSGVVRDSSALALELASLRHQTYSKLVHLLLRRGSNKMASSFVNSVYELASNTNSPALLAKALTLRAEFHLLQGDIGSAAKDVDEAQSLIDEDFDLETIDIRRLLGLLAVHLGLAPEARDHFESALAKVSDFCDKFRSFTAESISLHPILLGTSKLLRQHQVALELDSPIENDQSRKPEEDVEQQADYKLTQARRALSRARSGCQRNPVYSLVAESSISIPPASTCWAAERLTVPFTSIQKDLHKASEALLGLGTQAHRCLSVHRLRSLSYNCMDISILQRALQPRATEPFSSSSIASLLDFTANITHRHELAEAADLKLQERTDTSKWLHPGRSLARDSSDWATIREGIMTRQPFDPCSLPSQLPATWMAVCIGVNEAKDCLYVARYEAEREPLFLSLPMDRVGRRENEEPLFQGELAFSELTDIIDQANSTSQRAKSVKSDDDKNAWWSQRRELDERLKILLANVEHRWLGVFKVLLSPPRTWSAEALAEFSTSVTKTFNEGLLHKKARNGTPVFDDAFLQLFALVPPSSNHEDLEDLVHFILESHQFSGASVVLDEVDLDQVATDIRACLERLNETRSSSQEPCRQHTFLVLDKTVQAVPWESLPSFRSQSFSRIPTLAHLHDLQCLLDKRLDDGRESLDHLELDGNRTFYLVNPGGDLPRTQSTFEPWLSKNEHWDGIIGRPPMSIEIEGALSKSDIFIYMGHGGAESFIKSESLRKLRRCSAAFLWGCSSGMLKTVGQFDAYGTPWNYMMAGCPTLVANLWDVTDKDIDKFTKATFERTGFHRFQDSPQTETEEILSIPEAVGAARDTCLLRYLNGAAPVVYGIPAWVKL